MLAQPMSAMPWAAGNRGLRQTVLAGRKTNLDDLDSNTETAFNFPVTLTLPRTWVWAIARSLHFSEAFEHEARGIHKQVGRLNAHVTPDPRQRFQHRSPEVFHAPSFAGVGFVDDLLDKRQQAIAMKDVDRREPFGKMVLRLRPGQPNVISIE